MDLKDNLQHIFNSDYPGTDTFINEVIIPVFGDDIDIVNVDLAEKEEYREKAKKAGLKKIKYVANVRDDEYNSNKIAFFDVTIEKNINVERARVNIQQLIRSIVDNYYHILIVFHYENIEGKSWRFSYAYKQGPIANTTSAKRYTYVFGRDFRGRTAAERFEVFKKSDHSNKALEEAFSVEALSDEFFDIYRAYYATFVEYITGEKYSDEKKLKNIMNGWNWRTKDTTDQFSTTFDSDAKSTRDYIKKMFGRIVFLYFLQRKGWLYDNEGCSDAQYMKHLFDNASALQATFLDDVLEILFFYVLNTKPENRISEAGIAHKDVTILPGWDKIPFLNGGLFEQDDIDPKKCTFPAEYFRELFNFLNSYNFTIDENDQEDAEIGIDPEMLGRIFENLLEDNKDKGAFYTPKPIVDYMCRESIIAYLQDDRYKPEGNELIRKFIETLDIDLLNKEQRDEIEKKLLKVKICDPAIGSGAFPMGLVNLLSKIFIVLRTYSTIDQAKMKRYIMQQSIYGVDIEKGAVDIARLRFWLAMVVDETEPQPLPNQHFKIMQGNSLLEWFNGLNLESLMKPSDGELDYITEEERKTLRKDLNRFYSEDDHDKRLVLMNDIKNTVIRMIHNANPNLPLFGIDVSETDQFFMWHTWFADVFDKGGFDIVIGNPPYIDSETMTKSQPQLREQYAQKYDFAKGNWDIYIIFYELGLKLLKANGTLAYIVPNKWLSIGYGRTLREKSFNFIKTICDCRGVRVFEAGNEPIISILKNGMDISTITIGKIKGEKQIFHEVEVDKKLIDRENIGICISHYITLLVKIKQQGKTVLDLANVENPFSTAEAYSLIPCIIENRDAKNYRLINTGTIDPYINFWGTNKTAYLKHKYDFPQVDKIEFEKQFPRRVRQVVAKKIIMSGMRHFETFFDYDGKYVAGKSTIIVLDEKENDNLAVLQGIFNSKLLKFYIYQAFSTLGIGGGINFSKDMVAQLPIPISYFNKDLIALVKKVSEIKLETSSQDISSYLQRIDHIVYHLYDLTYDEVLIIDPETPITREEYENFKIEE